MRVVFCGTGWFSVVEVIRQRLPEAEVVIRAPGQSVADAVKDAHVVLPSNGRLDRDAIFGAAQLRLVQQPAAGYDGIDLDAAKERGIPVCNAPGTNSAAVAETALLLILTGARQLDVARREFAQAQIGGPLGLELNGSHILIVGKGQSGQRLGRATEALGMTVTYLDSRSTKEDLLNALPHADVVSLHCPLTSRTRHLLDRAAFSAMKPGVILVNTARGAIIERAALEGALAKNILGAVGLDVYWMEPWDPTDPLFAHDRVYTLPHMATSTHAAFERIADVVARNVKCLTSGQPLAHRLV